MTRNCRDCGTSFYPPSLGLERSSTHYGRGLCGTDYETRQIAGTLDEHPRAARARDEVLSEWELLRQGKVPAKDAPAKLGMTAAAFERAFQRARNAGDPRAVTNPGDHLGRHRDTADAVQRAMDAVAEPEPVNWAEAPTMRRALEHAFGR